MRRIVPPLVFLACLIFGSVRAQDLVIANARIIDGTGQVIERGTVTISDGRIAAVTGGESESPASSQIDASGLTIVPGLINVHWHLLAGSAADSEEAVHEQIGTVVAPILESLLSRGITTIMSPGDHFPYILDIRERLASGELRGPRLRAVGPVFTAPNDWPTQICQGRIDCVAMVTAEVTTPEQVSAKVRELADAHVDAVKLVYDDIIAPNARLNYRLIEEIADEARKYGLTLYAHVSTTEETGIDVVEAGAGALVHPITLRTPASENGTQVLRERSVAVATTIASRTREFREAIVELGIAPPGQGAPFTEADEALFRQQLASIDYLHEEGVTLAFGTDTVMLSGVTVETMKALAEVMFWSEVHALSQIMTDEELLASLTRDAAIYMGLEDEIGTLEPGKRADLILVNGDPLEDIDSLANVAIVVQSGIVVADFR